MTPEEARREAGAHVLARVAAYLAAASVICGAHGLTAVSVALALLAIAVSKEAYRILELEP